MEPCRICGTPFTGDACPRCGVHRAVDAWYPATPGPTADVPPADVPPAASGPVTPVSSWAPPIATTPYGTPPAPAYAAAPPLGTPPAPPPLATTPYATPYATPSPHGQGGPSHRYPPTTPRKRGAGRHLPLITGVLAGLLVVGLGFIAISGSGLMSTPKTGAASGAPTQKTSTKATASQSQTESSPSPTLTQSSSAYPDVSVPAGSKECARTGTGPFDAVGTANESTSCPFAVNVRDAYVAAGLNGTPGHVTASSPVTGQSYDMTCSGSQPVLCTGGVAARVVLYGGRLVVG
jgi:hypothetical protein